MKVAFLGLGNMGRALIQGAVRSKFLKPSELTGFDVDRKKSSSLQSELKINIAASNVQAVQGARFVFLCVKPQSMGDLLLEIKQDLNSKQCLISIAAGIPTQKIENWLHSPISVVRVMPNTPALVQSGVSAATKGRHAKKSDIDFAVRFFSSVGKVAVLPEKHFDAVTAVSGSGPAYIFYLTEALEKAAYSLGLPKEICSLFSRHTFIGAAKMMAESAIPALELRKAVTSPGGTTESAIRFLEEHRWQKAFVNAVRKARDRSRELSKA